MRVVSKCVCISVYIHMCARMYVRQCAQVCTSGRECVQMGGREGKLVNVMQ